MEPDEVKTSVGNAKALRDNVKQTVTLQKVFRLFKVPFSEPLFFLPKSAFAKILKKYILEGCKTHEQRQILCKKTCTLRHYDGTGNSSEYFSNNQCAIRRLNYYRKYASHYDDIHALGS